MVRGKKFVQFFCVFVKQGLCTLSEGCWIENKIVQ